MIKIFSQPSSFSLQIDLNVVYEGNIYQCINISKVIKKTDKLGRNNNMQTVGDQVYLS